MSPHWNSVLSLLGSLPMPGMSYDDDDSLLLIDLLRY